MFSDSVKQTITTQVRLNHCLPEHGVYGDKLLAGPSQLCGTASQEIWQAVTAVPPPKSAACALSPTPTARMVNVQPLIHTPLPLVFSVRWALSRLKSEGKGLDLHPLRTEMQLGRV